MRLRTKLFLIIIALSVVIVTAMLGFARWSVERAFVDFVETRRAARVERIAGRIESHYERHGSFDALAADTQVWLELYTAPVEQRKDVTTWMVQSCHDLRDAWCEVSALSPLRPGRRRRSSGDWNAMGARCR